MGITERYEEQIKRAEEHAARVNESSKRLIECYRTFARSEEGQVILQDLMDTFHITGAIYATGEQGAFKNGERNVVLYILSQAQVKLGVKYE